MKKIELLVSEYANINPFSGQVMVSKQNKIIEKLEYGYKDFETKTHFLEYQPFPIASITKQFTAVGILLQVEQLKLDLNQKLNFLFNIR